MKKLLVSIFVLTSTFLQSSLSDKLTTNQNNIKTMKDQVKAGKIVLNCDKCSGHTGGCGVK